MPERVTATIVAVSTYEDASRIMTKNFNGYTFSSGSKKSDGFQCENLAEKQ